MLNMETTFNRDAKLFDKLRIGKGRFQFDLSKIDNVQVEGVDPRDHPDYSDAFIASADYNGRPMTDEELDYLNDEYQDFVYEAVEDSLH